MSKLEDKKVLRIAIGVMIGVLTVALWGYNLNHSFQSAIGENNDEVTVVDAETFSENEQSIIMDLHTDTSNESNVDDMIADFSDKEVIVESNEIADSESSDEVAETDNNNEIEIGIESNEIVDSESSDEVTETDNNNEVEIVVEPKETVVVEERATENIDIKMVNETSSSDENITESGADENIIVNSIEDVVENTVVENTAAENVGVENSDAVSNEDAFIDFSIFNTANGYTDSQIAVIKSYADEIRNMPSEYVEEAKHLTRMLTGECGEWMNYYEMSLAAWTAYNRLDMPAFHQSSILGVVSAPNQYHGYSASHSLSENCYYVAKTVTFFYHLEKDTGNSVGRTLPSQYVYFWGDGRHNNFRDRDGNNFELWSTLNPYDYMPTASEYNN